MPGKYTFKTIEDAEILTSTNESSYFIIEELGDLKKINVKDIASVKTVNGNAPDADGNITIDVDFTTDALLPEATEENEGSFLRIVNGVWSTYSIPSAVGVKF